jgi:hypothetical protein
MDIKRVAFETRPVKSVRPAVSTQPVAQPVPSGIVEPKSQPIVTAGGGKIDRQEIAAIVDRFLAGRKGTELPSSPLPPSPSPEAEAGSMYSAPASSESSAPPTSPVTAKPPARESAPASNGNKATDFVSEDDVRRAIQKGEKIYINAKTIITPAARDMGEPAEIFAKAQ